MSVNGETGDFESSGLKRGQQDSNEKIISEEQKLRIELKRISDELNARKRELEIEAALEKVRATAIAMHNSEDLRAVVLILYEQLRILGFQCGVASITIMDPDTGDIDWWMEGLHDGYDLPERYHVPFFDHPGHQQQLAHWKSGTSYAEIEISGQEKKTYDTYYFFQTDFSHAPESSKELMMQQESVRFSMAYMKYGALSWSPTPLSEEQAKVLERFAKVFEQSYTRFLDLQKAEAQAREAQIQLSLERIRAKAMAMQHSDELSVFLSVLFEQFTVLDLKPVFCHLSLLDLENNRITYRMTGRNGARIFSSGQIDLNISSVWDKKIQELKSGRPREVDVMYFPNEIIPVISRHVKDMLGNPPENELPQLEDFPNGQYVIEGYCKYGYLGYSASQPPSDQEKEITRRIANEFGNVYQRFLDLQKAEAQAREAQIEAALERVRSASMAMHNSDELQKVIKVLTDQLTFIGLPYDTANFIVNESMPDWEMWISSPGSGDVPPKIHIDYFGHRLFKERNEAVEKGESFLTAYLDKNEKNLFLKTLFEKTLAKHTPEARKKWILEQPGMGLTTVLMKTISLSVINYQARLYSAKENEVIKRFATVFEQSYIRFLDLQKAEAQAREAQIEAALERVRAKAMSMHSSTALKEVVHELRKQMGLLGQKDLETCVIHLNEESPDFIQTWAAAKVNKRSEAIQEFTTLVPKHGFQIIEEALEAYSSGLKDYVLVNEGEKLLNWFKFLKKEVPGAYSLAMETSKDLEQSDFRVYWSFADFKGGALLMITLMPPLDTSRALLRRFANVFGLAYRRFADLKQAEAQAREAKIETALEKIRSRSLAMHHTEELKKVIQVVFDQFVGLNIHVDHAGFILDYKEREDMHIWLADHQQGVPTEITIPYFDSPHWNSYREAKAKQESFFDNLLPFEVKNKFYRDLFELIPELTEEAQQAIFSKPALAISTVLLDNVGLYIEHYLETAFSDDENALLMRFGKVFQQTYTRFLDLKKAEAQARESEIEVALEKVRSRSLAMHKSDELKDVVFSVFERLRDLKIQTDSTNIVVYFDEIEKMEFWTANDMNYAAKFSLPMTGMFYPNEGIEARNEQKFFLQYLSFEEKNRFWEELFQATDFRKVPEIRKNFLLEKTDCLIQLIAFGKFTGIMLNRHFNTPFSDAEIEIAERFAKVFDQSYTRFLDLQRAEAQAHEAQIEASLERVRSKAMSMHSSQDLASTIGTFYRELQTYSLTPIRCGVGLLSKEDRQNELFAWNTTEEGQSLELVGKIKMEGHPVLENVYDNWLTQTEYHSVLRGKEISAYYQVLRPQIAFPNYQQDEVQYGYFFFFPEGGVYAWTQKEMQEDELKIYRRFTSVLSLTYKRYKDLKDAEARALLAVRESSLARVRAEIASMRTAEDLQRITPLIWHELNALGVPFFRCGIFIVNENEQKMQVYLSNPRGNSLAILNLDFDSTETNSKAIAHWRSQKVYIEHWGREQFAAYTQTLIDQGQILTASSYQDGEEPPESLTLHFLPFSQGMLYVGSAGPLSDFNLELAMALAEAFSVAYARYEDFSRLESAKKQVEKTLVDLKQTQEQLVQQEKMASLGQLTAGIAHEIKNPLNFVNNFSEVSAELIDEVFGELEKLEPSDSKEEIIALLEDIKNNIAKVNEHGKRADGIVKSMLQHSRSAGNKTASKDFNPIVREFANLAYHGMRAGKSPINVEIDLQLDPEVGEVKLISEDFSRVILNLCNNAFDAMRDKLQEASSSQSDYLPRLTISTKKISNQEITLTIGDNGKGIPEEIIDKILEPFFTTKKGTEGTGLGLSISYDIIKAHGGKLEIRSTVGVGTEFMIQIPTDF